MRPHRVILTFALLWILISGVRAQDATGNTEQIIADIYEQVSEDAEMEIDFTSLYEDLMALTENPINLNKTNKEELEKLQFLSDTQIEIHICQRIDITIADRLPVGQMQAETIRVACCPAEFEFVDIQLINL